MDNDKRIFISECIYHRAKEYKDPEKARELKEFMEEFGVDGSSPEFYPEWSSGDEDIPLEELAVIETPNPEESAITSLLAGKGIFMGGAGLVPLKGSDQNILAGIFFNGKGEKIIRVLLRGEDGEFLSPIEISNADFILASNNNFELPNKNNLFYSDIRRFQKNTIRAIIDHLPYCRNMKYEGVLEMLKSSYMGLPVNRFIPDTASVETIYQTITRYVFQNKNKETCAICDAYFRLQSDDMERIAESLNMTVKEICKQLKEHGLLYLTPSSVAYQTKVRVDGAPVYCYCVRKPRQQEIEAVSKNALPTKELEDGVVSLNDGRVELTLQKYKELFGEKNPCTDGVAALQSASQEKTEV